MSTPSMGTCIVGSIIILLQGMSSLRSLILFRPLHLLETSAYA